MRAVIQRVSSASVSVAGAEVAAIRTGLVVLLGIAADDEMEAVPGFAAKVAGLRIFAGTDGKMNRSCADVGGAVLCISQFTLYGDVRRGNRPSFDAAASGALAEPLYQRFCDEIERTGLECRRGVFGAEMRVDLVNEGPVTLILDSAELDRPRRA